MNPITINFQISAEALLAVLQSIAAGQVGAQVLAEIRQLKDLSMTQNESIKALKDAQDAQKASTDAAFAKEDAALENIKADIAGLVAKIGTLGDLTPENQAILDSAIADGVALTAKVQARADALKTASDIVPDVTVEP